MKPDTFHALDELQFGFVLRAEETPKLLEHKHPQRDVTFDRRRESGAFFSWKY
ncbi:MAG: hypothetical protein RIU71_121 [Pseudomonadota bacterium]|jgi:hypothetical protein